jgi:predicted nucleotidyltransferase
LPTLTLRDRDAIITGEDLIFRVFGYSHPPNSYICDAEYAPATIFKSDNPKAPRGKKKVAHYKFYEDEAWKFLSNKYPQYLIFHEMLQKKVIGVGHNTIHETLKPQEQLERIANTEPQDSLHKATQNVLLLVAQRSNLKAKNFGVFGSMLHSFYHPKFSDIDLVIYGRKKLDELQKILQEFYEEANVPLGNEFETDEPVKDKQWRFLNLSPKEYVWHQKRKLIYALFKDKKTERMIKTEFEPVKDWKEITNEYDSDTRIVQKGWVRITAHVINDSDAAFMPSIYGIEPLKVLEGSKIADEAIRIVSYMEEYRLQAFNDETVLVEGNLEEVRTPGKAYYQIALTYCPRYYEQVLKLAST